MTDPTPAPDWRALCKELRDALENAFQVMAGEGGTQHISTATDVLLRADAHLATPPDRLRQCPTHGQQSENAWVCPECVRAATEKSSVAQSNFAMHRLATPPAATRETGPAPPEGLTDEQLLELASSHWTAIAPYDYDSTRVVVEIPGSELIAFARAAIAAHEAARPAPAPVPTREEIDDQFWQWWSALYPRSLIDNPTRWYCVAFSLHMLGQEVA
jgi:hypothetical protein